MTHVRVLRIGFLAMVLASLPAYAQIQRTFVSAGSGSDANPCTRPFPCRNFAAAIAETQSGGEVVVLDSGGYGTVVINQAVSIDAPAGVFAGIAVFAGNGIDVNAGVGDTVVLRGLVINGLGGSTGIQFNTGRALHVERCAVSRMTNYAIADVEAGVLFVKDTTVTACYSGILTGNGSQVVRAVIDNIVVGSTFNAVDFYPGSRATLRNSVITGNGTGFGVFVYSFSPGNSPDVIVENCTISAFGTGIHSSVSGGGTAITRVSNSTITHNTTGVSAVDAVNGPIRTRNNNSLQDNTTNGSFNGSFPAN